MSFCLFPSPADHGILVPPGVVVCAEEQQAAKAGNKKRKQRVETRGKSVVGKNVVAVVGAGKNVVAVVAADAKY